MLTKIVLVLSALALARAQIPSLGWCPEYVPMADFDMNRFLGVWYEAERYFQLSEVVSRCVMANYTTTADGKFRVSNEVINRFTGVKRILEGEIKPSPSKAEEGNLRVKYTTIPLTPETQYSVLETDYDNYAVLWSCSGIGPVHTQNAWLMTRQRLPSGEVLQKVRRDSSPSGFRLPPYLPTFRFRAGLRGPGQVQDLQDVLRQDGPGRLRLLGLAAGVVEQVARPRTLAARDRGPGGTPAPRPRPRRRRRRPELARTGLT
ncbi:apolipoprotein D isoform X2 [Orussus abietinus]|uniref:apolipoprotein D isoform X2 n=1 Tax=Orussus abietinus TaxID=222816 RepID=UPI000626D502|nr:apolipoprotein D isoform X2 [Orussus abietinus]